MPEPCEHYSEYEKEAEDEIFPFCDFEKAKSTWQPLNKKELQEAFDSAGTKMGVNRAETYII